MADEDYYERMPYPMARLYVDMLDEADVRIRYRALIKTFAGGLKYLSILCVADYLRAPHSESVNRVLADSLSRPSLGHWATFLGKISRAYRSANRTFHVPELRTLLSGSTSRDISHLIRMRNRYVHPDIMPSTAESMELLERDLPVLKRLLKRFEFLADCPLVQRESDGTERPLVGPVPPSGERADAELLVRNGSGELLDITPFLLLQVDPEFPDLLVYETLFTTSRSATYVRGDRLAVVEATGPGGERVTHLTEALERVRPQGTEELRARDLDDARRALSERVATRSFQLGLLKRFATLHSNGVLDSYIDRGRYDETTYVRRDALHAAYRDLLEAEGSVLVIAADSGAGKSTELCHLYTQQLKHDIVFFISGRATRASEALEVLESIARDADGQEVADIFSAIDRQRTSERLVILFDGINETDDPRRAFEQLMSLVELFPYPWLKLIVTCRSYAWRSVEASGALFDRRRFVCPDDGSLAHVLEGLEPDEFSAALERYAASYDVEVPASWFNGGLSPRERSVLRSPLLLRFVFEAFHHGAIPSPLDVDSVMQAFTKRRTRRRDRDFLVHHLMDYCYHAELDFVSTADLLRSHGQSAMAAGAGEQESRRRLAEHLLGDQVYEVDRVWRCPSLGCAGSGAPTADGVECARCGGPTERHDAVTVCMDRSCRSAPLPVELPCPRPACEGALYELDGYWFCEEDGCSNHHAAADFVPPRCACGRAMVAENEDNRSTYSRLLSENILSVTSASDGGRVRLVFDLYFDHLMATHIYEVRFGGRYDERALGELLQKAERSHMLVAALRLVLVRLWQTGERGAIVQVAGTNTFAAYHALREVFEFLAQRDLIEFDRELRGLLRENAGLQLVRRAAVHGLLATPSAATEHTDRVVELLGLLAATDEERLHEDIGGYLVHLKRGGHDLFSPILLAVGASLRRYIGVVPALRAALTEAGRRQVRGTLQLFLYTALFGLGNFFDDQNIRDAVVRSGGAFVRELMRHPVLTLLRRPLAMFMARGLARAYRQKGPLPCNYYEIAFQLDTDRDAIRRAGDLFHVEEHNVFSEPWDEFYQRVHSENGLVSWFMLSILPVHYVQCDNREQALAYLERMVREGTEMDAYVAAQAIGTLRGTELTNCGEVEALFERTCDHYEHTPTLAFLNPEPVARTAANDLQVAANSELVQRMRSDGDEHLLPWLHLDAERIDRLYFNWNFFQALVLRSQARGDDDFPGMIRLLHRNLHEDLQRFPGDPVERRRFAASFIIRTLAHATAYGCLREILNTYERIAREALPELEHADDVALAPLYRHALVQSLEQIKEHYRLEVLTFLERFDLDDPAFSFLAAVKSEAVEKEKLFSKSVYGHRIYQACFWESEAIRRAFGDATRQAAEAPDVKRFFFTYTNASLKWLREAEYTE